jgi:hypothetical protein
VYSAPLGLLGELSISHFVRGVMAPSNCSGVTLNPCPAGQRRITGVPPASTTMSMYETHAGVGTITSSPGSTVACRAL